MLSQYFGVTPIVKIVGDYCNLRCRYCFYATLNQSTPTIMSRDILSKVISQFMRWGGTSSEIHFIWHGGEPLLAGIDFFEDIVALQKKYNTNDRKIKNSVQTNATLINEEWANFFSENHFGVGVSIDGTPELHDTNRINVSGEGTFSKVVEGVKALRERGVNVSAIMVVTRDSLRLDMEEIFRTFLDLGIYSFGFNPYFEPNPARDHSFNEAYFITPDEYTEFLKRAIDIWIETNNESVRVREIDQFVAALMGIRPSSCSFNGTCAQYISVNYDGSVYPCERIPRTANNYYGSIESQTLPDILQSTTRRIFEIEVMSVPSECQQCPLFPFCHNGCTHHRVNGKYYFCETRKEVFHYVKEKIGSQIDMLQKFPSATN